MWTVWACEVLVTFRLAERLILKLVAATNEQNVALLKLDVM